MHEFPSLESILEAVANGKEPAGYVICDAGAMAGRGTLAGQARFVRGDVRVGRSISDLCGGQKE